MTRQGIDISNYTSPLTPDQVQYVRDSNLFVIIGLQDTAKARAFQQQLLGLDLEYYLDRPGRDLSIPHYRSRVWIDIEVGCYTQIADVDREIATLTAAEFTPGIYCNPTSLRSLDGPASPAWASLPLWYADYRTPDLRTFQPFNGWMTPTIWQYDSNGTHGINCDLNVSYEEEPAPPVVLTLEAIGAHYADGSDEEIWTPRDGKTLDGVGFRWSDGSITTAWP